MSKILVTGSNGMLGRSLQSQVSQHNEEFVFVHRQFGDLTIEQNVSNMYNDVRPDFVIHAAAKLGGIVDNLTHPADFFDISILINTFMLKYAKQYNVKKYLGISSVCALPYQACSDENNLYNGTPHPSNFAYACAKRMMHVQLEAYIQQFQLKNYGCVIPSNLYGPNDLYNLDNAHVIPALIHKIHLAKQSGDNLSVWGTGNASRDFVFIDDLAHIVLDLVIKQPQMPQRLIVADDKQHLISTIVEKLVKISGFEGRVVYDTTKPEGPSNRLTNNKLLRNYYPDFQFTQLDEGLRASYDWFINNYPNVRK